MEIAVVVVYAILLSLVAPFVLPKSDFYGKFVPFSIALAAGSVLWIVLTWVGMNYQEAWIWLIVMLAMPAASWFGANYLHTTRQELEAKELEAIRLRGKA